LQQSSAGKYTLSIFNNTLIRVSPVAVFIHSKSTPAYCIQLISIVSPSHGLTGAHVVSPVTPGGVHTEHGSHFGLAVLQLQDIDYYYGAQTLLNTNVE
jgi:hypothetical protein